MNTAQVDANQAADDAVAKLATAFDLLDDGFVVTSWVLVMASEHADRPGQTGYAHAFSGGHMADHSSVGLLTIALEQILYDEADADDDD